MAAVLYGEVIGDALKRRTTTTAQLMVLRHHANAVVEAQGDIKGALKKLDAEIKRRSKKASKKK